MTKTKSSRRLGVVAGNLRQLSSPRTISQRPKPNGNLQPPTPAQGTKRHMDEVPTKHWQLL
jgi:hypothetical protein